VSRPSGSEATKFTDRLMASTCWSGDHCTCASSTSWCPRTDLLFDVPGMHVLTVDRRADRFVLTIESEADVGGCPSCGVVAVGHGRRQRTVADAPVFGVPVRLVWLARLWRCREPACLKGVFTEQHDLLPPRAKLTSRAARWATDALTFDDTTVSALARHLGVDWHTCWGAVEAEATRRLADPARLAGVEVSGVDEHIWRPSRIGDKDRAVTGVVDLTRDPRRAATRSAPGRRPRSDRDRLRRLAQAATEHLHRRDHTRLPRPVPCRQLAMPTSSGTSCPTPSLCLTRSTW